MPAPLLVLADFTPAANLALAYATVVASRLQAPLVLLHVRRTSSREAKIPHRSEGEIAAELSRRTTGLAVPVSVEITNDELNDAVAAAVAQHQPQLIVLARPDSNLPDELINTTSLDLLRRTPVPLLVVPSTAPPTPTLQHVTIAADNQPFTLSPPVAELGQRLLAAFKPSVNITHVVEPEDDDRATVARQQVESSGLLAAIPHVTTRGQRHLHPPVEGILAAAEEDKASLLLLIARQHSILQRLFYQSVSARVVQRSPVPVLVLPALSEDDN